MGNPQRQLSAFQLLHQGLGQFFSGQREGDLVGAGIRTTGTVLLHFFREGLKAGAGVVEVFDDLSQLVRRESCQIRHKASEGVARAFELGFGSAQIVGFGIGNDILQSPAAAFTVPVVLFSIGGRIEAQGLPGGVSAAFFNNILQVFDDFKAVGHQNIGIREHIGIELLQNIIDRTFRSFHLYPQCVIDMSGAKGRRADKFSGNSEGTDD